MTGLSIYPILSLKSIIQNLRACSNEQPINIEHILYVPQAKDCAVKYFFRKH